MKLFVVFVMVAVLVAVASCDPVCTSQSVCKCITDKGAIDLTPLASKVLNCNNAKGTDQFVYSPCTDNITSPCLDAMVCRKSLTDHSTIGKSSGEDFIEKNGQIAIEYPGEDNKTSIVILECNQGEEAALSVVDDPDDTSYVFKLASRYACVGGPSTATTTKKATTKTTAKTTKTTPKTTKTTPKTTKTTAKTTKTSSKTTKTTPKTTKTSPKSAKTTKTTPKSGPTTKTTPKSTKTTPKNTKTTSHKTNTTPKIHTTTQGASSIFSFKMAALSVLMVICRQLF